MRHHVADLAVLPSRIAKTSQTLAPWSRSSVASIGPYDAVDLDPVLHLIELRLRTSPWARTRPVSQSVSGSSARCQSAVIGQQQQAFGVEIEPADADQPRRPSGRLSNTVGRLGMGMRGHHSRGL
jgi:hypothetical protein